MKFEEITYTNKTEILKYPDHYVAKAVMVDDAGIEANEDGKKIVPAGTIVGNNVLSTPTNAAKEHVPASLETELTGDDNDLVFTAKVDRTIKIAYVDPSANDQALAVSVSADTITISLATDENGDITTTAANIVAAIEGDFLASQLVDVDDAKDNDGTGVVTALEAAELEGGVNAEGVLINDVDVTYGDAPGAMIIHGFIDETKLPTVPSAQARADLKGVVFLK